MAKINSEGDKSEKMNDPIHPARQIPFPDLIAGLKRAQGLGHVHRRPNATNTLQLYIYTPRCVYEDGWDQFSLIARGLIVDEGAGRVVATPFPKFFNVGERHGEVPDLPFEAFEKLDGSLIIVFNDAGRWHAATKGAFDSEQALWAQARLDAHDLSGLSPDTTYLFEAVYPENRIVVRYAEPAMVMLAAYHASGLEVTYDEVRTTSQALGWRAAERHEFGNMADMMLHTATLPRNNEGFVVRFTDGLRLKLKGSEYRRIHALISRCTPLALWEAMAAGDDMAAIRRDLPEEFWSDFDNIVLLLTKEYAAMERKVAELAASVAHLSDKELGLTLNSLPADVGPYVFGLRKAGAIVGKSRDALMRSIRPTGNVLPGYQPSYAMGRVIDEATS
ncbi:T4 RnlA family RNA ligase [Rhizobium leguminosarum]|uniref:T4 RnlA family RNA ligase n=1 Tax=Rhizobium leguminosarum TaxID=384 RepID=UPI001FDF9421|nr:T4 RnlA family RNA ligase [Rhizobium leguminosarum]